MKVGLLPSTQLLWEQEAGPIGNALTHEQNILFSRLMAEERAYLSSKPSFLEGKWEGGENGSRQYRRRVVVTERTAVVIFETTAPGQPIEVSGMQKDDFCFTKNEKEAIATFLSAQNGTA